MQINKLTDTFILDLYYNTNLNVFNNHSIYGVVDGGGELHQQYIHCSLKEVMENETNMYNK